MFKEVGRNFPPAVFPIAEVDGAASADRAMDSEPKRLESAQRLAAVVEQATEQILAATMQRRAAKVVEWALAQLKPDACVEQLNYLTNQIQGFAASASNFLERGDLFGLEGAISTFNYAVRDLEKMAPPKPPLVPAGDTVFYNAGWGREEEYGLRTILLKGLCGVVKGDRCISIDAAEATLASGMRISRKQARDAYVPPAAGRMIAVGSLPRMIALAIRGRS